MDPAPRPKRPFGLGTYLLILLGVGLLGGVAGGVGALLDDRPGTFGLALTAAVLSLVMAIAFAASIWWWRGIDEAAREAHKWAWWWGGSGGMAVGAILVTTLTLREDGAGAAFFGLIGPDLVTTGMWTILLFQLVGYGVAWSVWWLKHR
ncbi:MAG: hypothetical protein QME55_12330 [Brevundimonas sp.]|uniref:hypothetical protein n=1 Tax=Brevundimonas sp. TaxID=1871086 RepID=UPI0026271995|nr:hypothetical protein [Brevundimonas sp.]MDI6625510.1 hypothetical protein [Brevundimonas sp.]MDQ7813389.1 hypothetical protein [Brevundimonas sp.]